MTVTLPPYEPLPAAWVRDTFGPQAETWEAQGIQVIPTAARFEIRHRDGDLLGLFERDTSEPGMRPAEPLVYKAVIRVREEAPWWTVRYPDVPVPLSPAAATAAMRARWGIPGYAGADRLAPAAVYAVVPESDPDF